MCVPNLKIVYSFIRLRNIGTFRCAALIDPVTLTFDFEVGVGQWESHVTWGTPVQSFVFLGLLVFELEPISCRLLVVGHVSVFGIVYIKT